MYKKVCTTNIKVERKTTIGRTSRMDPAEL